MNLFEMTNEYRHILNEIEECEGDPTESVIAMLEQLESDIGNKADGYCSLINHYQAYAKAAQEEAARIAKRSESFANRAKWLKDRLKAAMESLGETKIKTPYHSVTICKNGGAQPIKIEGQPENLPEEFRMVVIKPNTDAIREALVAGQTVPGCQLEPRGNHLRIN